VLVGKTFSEKLGTYGVLGLEGKVTSFFEASMVHGFVRIVIHVCLLIPEIGLMSNGTGIVLRDLVIFIPTYDKL
jgi:hypothetical protein